MKTDHPWKDVLEEHLREALEFKFGGIAALIDWAKFPASREQEMRKILPDSATGDRIVDKLLGCTTTAKEVLYLHAEVQGKPEDAFPNRFVEYNDAASLHLRHPVLSVAILVDDDPKWKPASHLHEREGFRKHVEWPTFKALDWLGRCAELERHPNPFAFFLLCHLRAQATEKDAKAKEAENLRLLLLAVERKMEDTSFWLRMLDWLMPLSAEAQARVEAESDRREGGKNMPFVSFVDRRVMEAEDKARKDGMEKGIKDGMEKGMALGMLKFRFGDAGAALAPRLAKAEAATLQAVCDAVENQAPLEEISKLLP